MRGDFTVVMRMSRLTPGLARLDRRCRAHAQRLLKIRGELDELTVERAHAVRHQAQVRSLGERTKDEEDQPRGQSAGLEEETPTMPVHGDLHVGPRIVFEG
jgi:hypothetical protein